MKYSLHYALIHAGYTVDFVDDYDLAGGALQQRGYTTLYVTGPNVANDRNMISQPSNSPPIPSPQEQIKSWVNDGGVLAVTLGGGVADEYNTLSPSPPGSPRGSPPIFDTILGLQYDATNPRTANREPVKWPPNDFDMAGTMTITDPHFGSRTMYISNPIGTLTVNTTDPNPASSIATLYSGDPSNPTSGPAIINSTQIW